MFSYSKNFSTSNLQVLQSSSYIATILKKEILIFFLYTLRYVQLKPLVTFLKT